MENQPSAINFNQAWSGGTRNACSLYTTFRKIEKRYINPIIDDIKQVLDDAITKQVQKVPASQVGVHFLRFCGKWDLQRISTSAESHSEYLNNAY